MKIRVETNDWLYNAALTGLYNILEYNNVKFELNPKNNLLTVADEYLKQFSEYYFYYFIKKYQSFTSWYDITQNINKKIKYLEDKIDSDDNLKQLNNCIEKIKKRLESNSYKNTYAFVERGTEIPLLSKQIKKISKKKSQSFADIQENVRQVCQVMDEAIQILKHPTAKRYICARNIIYDVIGNFWKDVSFLHVKANVKDMYEEYTNYFIQPLFSYMEEIQDEAKRKKHKYQCFCCGNSFKSKGDGYELTWMTKTGVDGSRKSSHYWNYIPDAIICPICNFIYSCVPAGFTYLNGKGLFVNENITLKSLAQINQFSEFSGKTFDQLEEETYFKVLDAMDQKVVGNLKSEVQNIQIVKLDAKNEARPYSFNVLSREKLYVISMAKNRLKNLLERKSVKEDGSWINLYQEVLKRIYANQNQYDLLYRLFKLRVRENKVSLHAIEQIIYINEITRFKGGENMESEVQFKVQEFQKEGLRFRKLYLKKGENKLHGISYRLLNAIKVKNPEKFMDTVINAYMYQSVSVPKIFLSALDENEFQTVGYAFLLGVQGETKEERFNRNIKKTESSETKEENENE